MHSIEKTTRPTQSGDKKFHSNETKNAQREIKKIQILNSSCKQCSDLFGKASNKCEQ